MRSNLEIPNPVLVLSSEPSALGGILWKFVRPRAQCRRILVLDYQGRGQRCVDNQFPKLFENRKVCWIDYANRLRPPPGLRFRKSEQDRWRLSLLLNYFFKMVAKPMEPELLESISRMAVEHAGNDHATLGSVLRSVIQPLAVPEFAETEFSRRQWNAFAEVLQWCLRYPMVAALSEGGGKAKAWIAPQSPDVIWMESVGEYFERLERYLVNACMISEGVFVTAQAKDQETSIGFDVLHLLPSVPLIEHHIPWLCMENDIRHTVVLYCHRGKLPHGLQLILPSFRETWMWGKIQVRDSSKWWNAEQKEQIAKNTSGHLLVLPKDGKAFCFRLRVPHLEPHFAHILRRNFSIQIPTVSVLQLGSWLVDSHEIFRNTGKFYHRIADREMLFSAWQRIRKSNRDSCGVDGVTIQMFSERLNQEIPRLAAELGSRTYQCHPIKQVSIPKPDGGTRKLGIPSVRDRVVQMACLEQIEPLFESGFSPFSFGFRPRRSAHQALSACQSILTGGRSWVVKSDIQKCFDSIDHEILLGLLSLKIQDNYVLDLIRQWLQAEVIDFREGWWNEMGVPQGEAISPLLANVYLDVADQFMKRQGVSFVRYADDLVCFCESEEGAVDCLKQLEDFLWKSLRLKLKSDKTHIFVENSPFPFLGFSVTADEISILPDRMNRVIRVLRDAIIPMTYAVPSQSIVDGISRINAIIRGYRNYFAHEPQEGILRQMKNLDLKLEEMATGLLPEEVVHGDLWKQRETFLPRGADTAKGRQQGVKSLRSHFGRYPAECVVSPESNGEDTMQWILQKNPDPAKVIEGSLAAAGESGWKGKLGEALIWEEGRLFLYLHGCYVKTEKDGLCVRKNKKDVAWIPFDGLRYVMLQGIGVSLASQVAMELGRREIPLAFCSATGFPDTIASCVRVSGSDLRRLQVLRRNEPAVRLCGQKMIAAKIGNQRAVLKYFSKYRPETKHLDEEHLESVSREMKNCMRSIQAMDPCMGNWQSMLMGYEGRAAARYWDMVQNRIPEKLGFAGRIKRGATDVVNMCLNYLYGILYTEVWRAAVTAGLDPYFGIVHQSGRDQGSLVFDLIEEFRAPFVDRVVLGMVGRGFSPIAGRHGRLRTSCLRRLAKAFFRRWLTPLAWRQQKVSPQKILDNQVRELAGLFESRATYKPYRMKW